MSYNKYAKPVDITEKLAAYSPKTDESLFENVGYYPENASHLKLRIKEAAIGSEIYSAFIEPSLIVRNGGTDIVGYLGDDGNAVKLKERSGGTLVRGQINTRPVKLRDNYYVASIDGTTVVITNIIDPWNTIEVFATAAYPDTIECVSLGLSKPSLNQLILGVREANRASHSEIDVYIGPTFTSAVRDLGVERPEFIFSGDENSAPILIAQNTDADPYVKKTYTVSGTTITFVADIDTTTERETLLYTVKKADTGDSGVFCTKNALVPATSIVGKVLTNNPPTPWTELPIPVQFLWLEPNGKANIILNLGDPTPAWVEEGNPIGNLPGKCVGGVLGGGALCVWEDPFSALWLVYVERNGLVMKEKLQVSVDYNGANFMYSGFKKDSLLVVFPVIQDVGAPPYTAPPVTGVIKNVSVLHADVIYI